MKVRRYSVKGFLSFDVHEGEDPEEKLAEVQAAYDEDKVPPGHSYFGVDDGEGPFLEDEFELEEIK